MSRPSACAIPLFVKVRIDADALLANRATAAAIDLGENAVAEPPLRYRPIWWLQMPNGREVRAHHVTWGALTTSHYEARGRSWSPTERVSAWLEVHGPVIADGTLYDPNAEK